MPDRSKVRAQTKCSSWSSSLGAGRGANNPTLEKSVTKSAEPMKEEQGGGQDPHKVVALVMKKKKKKTNKKKQIFYECDTCSFTVREEEGVSKQSAENIWA
jgi:hypothetical protein